MIMNIIKRLKEWHAKWSKETAIKDSKSMFQVREYNGELWLTHGESLICPCSYFKEDYAKVLHKVRESYIKRQLA